MPIAEPLPDNIRRIAVLVASVDSATARQLLLHLPTSVAKHVRRALQNLGPISAAERQRILTEFQATAAKEHQVAANQASAASLLPASVNHLDAAPMVAKTFSPENLQASWQLMDIRALSHFLRGERVSLIAVVINQLSPEAGVALLQQLPATTHREVLHALANLQDIDDEAMQSIEQHLAARLKDYEQQVKSESQGTRRIAALLAAAPLELQETWSKFVHIAFDASQDSFSEATPSADSQTSAVSAATPVNAARPRQTTAPSSSGESASIDASFGAPIAATVDMQREGSSGQSLADSNMDDHPHLLPFPGPHEVRPLSHTDRSLIQLEFEQILALSTHQLAQVLTATDSQTVLLALAGASPAFMKRFYSMLTKADGKVLSSRLSKIGPLKLRDIDEAQRSIAELAAQMQPPRSNPTSHSQALRAVA